MTRAVSFLFAPGRQSFMIGLHQYSFPLMDRFNTYQRQSTPKDDAAQLVDMTLILRNLSNIRKFGFKKRDD
jgi:hypothetical protein